MCTHIHPYPSYVRRYHASYITPIIMYANHITHIRSYTSRMTFYTHLHMHLIRTYHTNAHHEDIIRMLILLICVHVAYVHANTQTHVHKNMRLGSSVWCGLGTKIYNSLWDTIMLEILKKSLSDHCIIHRLWQICRLKYVFWTKRSYIQ